MDEQRRRANQIIDEAMEEVRQYLAPLLAEFETDRPTPEDLAAFRESLKAHEAVVMTVDEYLRRRRAELHVTAATGGTGGCCR